MPTRDEIILKNDGAAQISSILREHFAPDAVDAVYQEVAPSLHSTRTEQSMDES